MAMFWLRMCTGDGAMLRASGGSMETVKPLTEKPPTALTAPLPVTLRLWATSVEQVAVRRRPALRYARLKVT